MEEKQWKRDLMFFWISCTMIAGSILLLVSYRFLSNLLTASGMAWMKIFISIFYVALYIAIDIYQFGEKTHYIFPNEGYPWLKEHARWLLPVFCVVLIICWFSVSKYFILILVVLGLPINTARIEKVPSILSGGIPFFAMMILTPYYINNPWLEAMRLLSGK